MYLEWEVPFTIRCVPSLFFGVENPNPTVSQRVMAQSPVRATTGRVSCSRALVRMKT